MLQALLTSLNGPQPNHGLQGGSHGAGPREDPIETSLIEALSSLQSRPKFHEIVSTPNEYHQTLAHLSILYGYPSLLGRLVEWHIDLTISDVNGLTALHCAYMKGDLDCVKILRRGGASEIVTDRLGRTPLELQPEGLERLDSDIDHEAELAGSDAGRYPVADDTDEQLTIVEQFSALDLDSCIDSGHGRLDSEDNASEAQKEPVGTVVDSLAGDDGGDNGGVAGGSRRPMVIPIALSRTRPRGARLRSSAAPELSPIDTLTPPTPITRSASHGSRAAPVSAAPPLSPLDRPSKSLKPRRRSKSTRQGASSVPSIPSDISITIPLSAGHDIKPLETSANRWIPSSIANRGHHPHGTARYGVSVPEVEPPETIERKVKALLNKLTMEKFNSISHQIVAWANKSETEVDGATLQLVIKLVFENATDEATWSHMYARLCHKMMEHVSSDVRDENVKDKHGNFIAGGQLFRQYLLSRCQTDFERGWSAREELEEKQEAVVAASGAAPDEVVFSDEYYALQKATRRGLGLVKFIGELFKLQMLTERVIHRCVQRLLDEPAEEDIESACQLLITVGSALSGPRGKDTIDLSIEKMKELVADCTVSSRIRFMLQVSVLRIRLPTSS